MDRRKFVSLAIATATVEASSRVLSYGESANNIKIEEPNNEGQLMPLDFTGLSYETGQLYNANFFAPQNTSLIQAFRGLSEHGVLRLGGHLSNITVWEGAGQNDPKQIRGVRHGIEDYWEWPLVDPTVQRNKKGILSRKAIENLRDFLDAVNWRLIYGFNFACGSAERAADEAAFVSKVMGERLIAFVVGNEADGFGEDPFFRPKDYDFEQYFQEYKHWVKTVRARVPKAPFAGPDTEGNVKTWVKEYAKRTKGDTVFLTSHFYGMGPASDPRMTAERLLRKTNEQLEEEIVSIHEAIALGGGVPYRMAEGNSCFGGGRKGVSDAYASALWAADYMLKAASAGLIGVNFHGGGTGIYAPIESSDANPAKPRPVYYGIQFGQQFAGYKVSPCKLQTTENISAYWATKAQSKKLAIINKGPTTVSVQIPADFLQKSNLQCWKLSGPSLDAKEGITFSKESTYKNKWKSEIGKYTAYLFEA